MLSDVKSNQLLTTAYVGSRFMYLFRLLTLFLSRISYSQNLTMVDLDDSSVNNLEVGVIGSGSMGAVSTSLTDVADDRV